MLIDLLCQNPYIILAHPLRIILFQAINKTLRLLFFISISNNDWHQTSVSIFLLRFRYNNILFSCKDLKMFLAPSSLPLLLLRSNSIKLYKESFKYSDNLIYAEYYKLLFDKSSFCIFGESLFNISREDLLFNLLFEMLI